MMVKIRNLFFILMFGICGLTLQSFADELQIENMLNEKTTYSGANCFNTSLRAINLMETKRYIHVHEMREFLTSQCKKSKTPLPFSLGLIEMKESSLPMHSFITLNEGKVFTKNGASKREIPKINDFTSMISLHEKAINFYCLKEGLTECEYHVQYYDCLPRESALIELENHFLYMLSDMKTFHNQDNKSLYENYFFGIDFSTSCLKKKFLAQSMTLELSLRNSTTDIPSLKKSMNTFFKRMIKIVNQVECRP